MLGGGFNAWPCETSRRRSEHLVCTLSSEYLHVSLPRTTDKLSQPGLSINTVLKTRVSQTQHWKPRASKFQLL